MKKIALYIILATTSVASAQMKVAQFPRSEGRILGINVTDKEIRKGNFAVPTPIYEQEVAEEGSHNVPFNVSNKAPQAENQPGYRNPDGTFFLGIDEAGKGAWMTTNGVIGASSDTLDCWVWPNTATGSYRSIKYETLLSDQYPSYVEEALYAVNRNGDFCDSITSKGGWDEAYAMGADGDAGYLWQMATPLQTVTRNDGTQQTFQLLKKSGSYSAQSCAYAAGGLPSGATEDGLWPLTLAEPIQPSGVSMTLGIDKDQDGYVHYIYGSDSLTYDFVYEDEQYIPTRKAPLQLITDYDKPQAPLYIKSITLALGADGYDARRKDTLKVNHLYLEIRDHNDNVVATSEATAANKSNLTYKNHLGQLLTFNFKQESAYGEVLSEGVLLDDAFRIIISGFSPDDRFGVYAASTFTNKTHTFMLYEDNIIREYDYEPYIMLNGIMPRWEPYTNFKQLEDEGYKTGVHGDTININMVSASTPYYKYSAYFTEDFSSYTGMQIYSTFTPYDSVTLMWNLEIECPPYITLGADYTSNIGSDDDPITLWEFARLFEIYIYATDVPQLGDYIKIGKAGRYTYFHITEIDGATAIDEVTGVPMPEKAKKVIENGQIYILKDGKRYSILGI